MRSGPGDISSSAKSPHLSPLTASTADHASTVPPSVNKSSQVLSTSIEQQGIAPSPDTHQAVPPIMRVTGGRRPEGGWKEAGRRPEGGCSRWKEAGWMAGWRPRAVREATRGRLVSVARPYATQPQRRHQRESTTGRGHLPPFKRQAPIHFDTSIHVLQYSRTI